MTLLSVLDQTPVIDGHSVADAIAATVELAQLADDLGYTRYWCAEHHGLRGVSNPCPEVMLARLGSVTRRIRLGSGGVMLPYYSPFKVAEQFMMLEALFPNRIDLGVGRAPGGDMRTAQAVAAGDYNRGDIFPQQVADLVGLMQRHAARRSHRATACCCSRRSTRVRSCGCSARANSAACWPRNSASASRSRISSTRISGIRWRTRIASASRPVRNAAALSGRRRVRDLRRHRTGSRRSGKSRRPAPRADGLWPERADSDDRTGRRAGIRRARATGDRSRKAAQHHRHAGSASPSACTPCRSNSRPTN